METLQHRAHAITEQSTLFPVYQPLDAFMTKHSCAWASMRDCRALVLSAAMSGVGGVCRYANTISRSLWYVPAAPCSVCVCV